MEQERALVWQAGCSALESGRGESEAGEGDHRGREREAGRDMLLVRSAAWIGSGGAEEGGATRPMGIGGWPSDLVPG